jgi:hypothetical protein
VQTRETGHPAYICGMLLEYPVKTQVPHAGTRADAEHLAGCCGCWNLYRGGDGKLYAQCNECGVVQNDPLPAGVEPYIEFMP